MKKQAIVLASALLILPTLSFAGGIVTGPGEGTDNGTPTQNLGSETAGLAALGLVGLIIGAQAIKRRKK